MALAFSGFTYIAHDRKLKKQEQLMNDYQLRLMAQNDKDNKSAVIRAKSVKTSGGRRTLFIINSGKAVARNLIVNLPNPDEVYGCNVVFPRTFDELLPGASREFQLFLSEGDDELTLNYTWDDDYKADNKETQKIDL